MDASSKLMGLRLKDFCIVGPTDYDEIVELASGGDLAPLLPSALSDSLLLSIARDIRTTPASAFLNTEDGPIDAVMLVVCVLLTHSSAFPNFQAAMKAPAPILMEVLRMYRKGVEKEIVNRLVGAKASADSLLEAIDDAVASSRSFQIG